MPFWDNFNNKNKEEIKNWYNDRYVSVLIQRNFLIFLATMLSLGILICLILIKNLNENRSIDPYIIEYDKSTGLMTVVESGSKKEYTSQEAVKESLIIQYIKAREEIKMTTIEDSMNYVRVSSTRDIYAEYLKTIQNNINTIKVNEGKNVRYKINILSLSYYSSSRIGVEFTRTLISDDKDIKVEKFKLIMTFQFVDLEATVDDLHLNPLGFQVSYYRVNLEDNVLQKNNTKVFDNNIKTDTIKDTIKDNINDY